MTWLRGSAAVVACLLLGSALALTPRTARAAPPVHHPLRTAAGPFVRPSSPGPLGPGTFPTPTQGYIPCDLRNAYGLRDVPEQGEGVTIGIADAYDQPNLESDLHAFDAAFGIPDPPGLDVVRQAPFSSTDRSNLQSWQLETSMDVEYAHALAPRARLVVVLASDESHLLQSLSTLTERRADVASLSWGAPEFAGEDTQTPPPGPLYAAASGDYGQATSWPAVLPQVGSVGGTSVLPAATGHDTTAHTSCTAPGQPVTSATQTAWPGSGGGASAQIPQPSYQRGVVSVYSQTQRVQNDVALDADPATGVAVYDSAGYEGGPCDGSPGNYSGCTGFLPFLGGGTSLATPLLAAGLARLDEHRMAHGAARLTGPGDLYRLQAGNSKGFQDVTAGSNGSCGATCSAGPGYDSVTGFGSPSVGALEAPAI